MYLSRYCRYCRYLLPADECSHSSVGTAVLRWVLVLRGVGGSCQILEINILLMQRPGLLLVSVFCPVFMGYLQQLYTLSHLSQQVNVLDNKSQVDRI